MTDDKVRNSFETSGDNLQGNIQGNQGNIRDINNYFNNNYPAPVIDEQTKAEFSDRRVLLSKVKQYWIEGVLEKSLHTKAMIELGLEKRSDAVKLPFSGFEELPEESRQILPTGTDATEVFNQIGEGRTLLILGEPGAGKTITLLKLAQNLIARAEGGLSRLIPVVLNLSSWGSKQQTIADWLVQELWSKYGVSKEVGKNWVKKQQLLLLLDGLDEVKADRREACVEAINQFMQKHGQTEMVVCSRIADYQVLSNRLQLRGAIYIRSLTPEQVNQYLDNAGEQLGAVKTLLTEDTALQELAKSPLTLSIMTLAYQGKKVEEILQTGSVEARREHLFDAYIKRMFSQEKIGKPKEYKSPYQNQQAKSWLTWLAQRMKQESESVFLIEKMQPTWLSLTEKRVFLIGSTLTGWIFIGIAWRLFQKGELDIFLSIVLILVPLCFRIFARFCGWEWSNGEILTYESINLSWTTIKELIITIFLPNFSFIKKNVKSITIIYLLSIVGSLFFFIIFGGDNGLGLLLVALLSPFMYSYVVNMLRIISLPFIVSSVLKGGEVENKIKPNQGIWMTGKNAIILGGINVIFFGFIIFILTICFDKKPNEAMIVWSQLILALGVIGSLTGGVLDCIRHIQLRLFLSFRHHAPWNYARFLDYASDRIFLQKVGGGYIFVHRMLLEHFARMK
ncbi:MAG: NACHT domain-containing protein [Microcystis sp. LE18-22.4A]|uniref:NACHT domain-containing protein n=1 Tax=Microcystis sp. LE18-22.4A TaxID=3016432 RepID=UPI0022C25740|nr:NACHT domain-containing protein [Microcystis sp. LE18-22.4A]MCZ8118286.1 NACHT domain-containing protein [Microcystis sp. LE18-22.4A]